MRDILSKATCEQVLHRNLRDHCKSLCFLRCALVKKLYLYLRVFTCEVFATLTMLYIYDSFDSKRKYLQSRKIEYVVISSAQISLVKTKLKQKLIHKKCLKGCASTGGHTIQQHVYKSLATMTAAYALKPRGWLTIQRCVWGRGLRNEVRFSHLGTLSASDCLVFLGKPTRQPLCYYVI